jgi:hypothetical protein
MSSQTATDVAVFIFMANSARIATMLQKMLLSLSLALLLSIGQQGAVLHELSHFSGTEALYTDSAAAPDQDQAPHSPACEKCLGYAGLGHSITTAITILPVVSGEANASPDTYHIYQPILLRAYTARAPPILA